MTEHFWRIVYADHYLITLTDKQTSLVTYDMIWSSKIHYATKNSYWFPVMGLSWPFLISSQPLTHGCPGVARVSGEAWLFKFFITFSWTAANTFETRITLTHRRISEVNVLKKQRMKCYYIWNVCIDLTYWINTNCLRWLILTGQPLP